MGAGPRTRDPKSSTSRAVLFLEDQLQPHLDHAWVGGRSDLAESGRAEVGAYGARASEERRVSRVVEFATVLETNILTDICVLDDGEIEVHQPGGAQRATTGIAEKITARDLSVAGDSKGGASEPIVWPARCLRRVSNDVGPAVGESPSKRDAERRSKREPALQRRNPAELPAAYHAVDDGRNAAQEVFATPEGQFVVVAKDCPPLYVEFEWTV